MKLIQNEKKILNEFKNVESKISDLEVLNQFYQNKEISEEEIHDHYNNALIIFTTTNYIYSIS